MIILFFAFLSNPPFSSISWWGVGRKLRDKQSMIRGRWVGIDMIEEAVEVV